MLEKFVLFCRNNFDLESTNFQPPYNSLSICLIDCVYSLQAKYFSVTIPVVQRYADRFMNGNMYGEGDSLDNLISNIDANGGALGFAENVLGNKQKVGGELKSFVVYNLAKALRQIGINDLTDFRGFQNINLLELVVKSVKGIGDAALNYLFILAGDQNRCKPDVHIHQCICDACGHDVSNEECQELLTAAVRELANECPNLTVARLDHIIWDKYQSRNR